MLTERGNADANQVPCKYVMQRPQVMDLPDVRNYARTLHDMGRTLILIGVTDPSLRSYSPTATSKGVTADQTWYETLADSIPGRRPMSDYDRLQKDWQNAACNQARSELQQVCADSQP